MKKFLYLAIAFMSFGSGQTFTERNIRQFKAVSESHMPHSKELRCKRLKEDVFVKNKASISVEADTNVYY